jgi:outer membrane protein assembly complex protein YaeT
MLKKILLLTMILILQSFLLFSEEKSEGKIIHQIIFKGLKKAKLNDVISTIASEEGKALDLNLINEDYKNLMGLGFFDDVFITTDKAFDEKTKKEIPNSIILTYEFVEKKTVRKIIFKGNKNLSFATLLNEITIKYNSFVDLATINSDIAAITNKYHEKGYNYVKVSYELYENDDLKKRNKVDVVFNIDEGIETYVSEIVLNGNNSINDFTIKSKMKTKERKYLGLQKGTFVESVFYQDIEELKKYYKDMGYFLIDIAEPEIVRFEIEEKGVRKELIRIIINFKEGSQYKFGSLFITGNKLISTEDLLFGIKLRPGQIFNFSRYQETLYSMQMKYTTRGYIETRIKDKTDIDESTKTINVKIDISESKCSYVEAIYFKGNSKTKDYVLKRAIYMTEGEIFNSNKLMDSMIGLYNLGFFSNVDYDIQPGSASGLLIVTFVVEEQKTAEVKFGVSIPANFSQTGQYIPEITLFAQIQEKNFLGRELNLSSKVEGSLYKQGFNFSLDDPWFLSYPWSFGASVSLYHNWIRKVYRKIKDYDRRYYYKHSDDGKDDVVEYMNKNGITDVDQAIENLLNSDNIVSDEDVRQYYNDEFGYADDNPNYMGYSQKDFFKKGLHNLNFNVSTNMGYRFLKYFSVSGTLSCEPIYTWYPVENYSKNSGYEDISSPGYANVLLGNTNGWGVRNKISTTFSMSTTKRLVNPFEGIRFSITPGYIFGHYDAFTFDTKFTSYFKILDIMFGDWQFQNVIVFNAGISLIMPGFRDIVNDPNNYVFRDYCYGKGPILYGSDYLTVDGMFSGRGWGSTLGSYSATSGPGSRVGYVKFDYTLEYRFPIYDKIVWAAAFIDMVNLVSGPAYDKNYNYSFENSWIWWKTDPKHYQPMGIENWYGSIGVGLEFTFPQLPLSFFVVKRFKINYYSGFEWVQDSLYSKTGYLDFILSITGFYF